MSRVGAILRFLFVLVVFSAVVVPLLTRAQLTAEAAECERRRALLAHPEPGQWSLRVCPRGETPYLYAVDTDSTVVIRCANGHGQQPLPFHVWVEMPR